MLIIHGHVIGALNHHLLQQRFGRQGLGRPDWIDDILEYFINDPSPDPHRYPSTNILAREILTNHLRRTPLRLWYLHPNWPGPYPITMSGSRIGDNELANKEAELGSTPEDYTWHHAEGITYIGSGRYRCQMYLVESGYHRTAHYGGVHEYELFTGERYN